MGAVCGCCLPSVEEGPKEDGRQDREPLLQRRGSHGSLDTLPTDQLNTQPAILTEQQHIDLVTNHPLSSQSPSKQRRRSPNNTRGGLEFVNPQAAESSDLLRVTDREDTILTPADIRPEVQASQIETSALLHAPEGPLVAPLISPLKDDSLTGGALDPVQDKGSQHDPKFSEWVDAQEDNIGALNEDRSNVLVDLQNVSTTPPNYGTSSPHHVGPVHPNGGIDAAVPLVPATDDEERGTPTIDWSGNVLPQQAVSTQDHHDIDMEFGLLTSAEPIQPSTVIKLKTEEDGVRNLPSAAGQKEESSDVSKPQHKEKDRQEGEVIDISSEISDKAVTAPTEGGNLPTTALAQREENDAFVKEVAGDAMQQEVSENAVKEKDATIPVPVRVLQTVMPDEDGQDVTQSTSADLGENNARSERNGIDRHIQYDEEVVVGQPLVAKETGKTTTTTSNLAAEEETHLNGETTEELVTNELGQVTTSIESKEDEESSSGDIGRESDEAFAATEGENVEGKIQLNGGPVAADESRNGVDDTEKVLVGSSDEKPEASSGAGLTTTDSNENLQRIDYEEVGIPELDQQYKLHAQLINEYFDTFHRLQTTYKKMLVAYEKLGLKCVSLLPVFIMLKGQLSEEVKSSLNLERKLSYQIIFEASKVPEQAAAIFRDFNTASNLLTDLIGEDESAVIEVATTVIDSEEIVKDSFSEGFSEPEQEKIRRAISKMAGMMRNVIPSMNYMKKEARRVQDDLEGAALVFFTQEDEKERVEEQCTLQRSFITL